MRRCRDPYELRGERERRRVRIRKGALALGFLTAVALGARGQPPHDLEAEEAPRIRSSFFGDDALRDTLDATRGELDLARSQLQRANMIIGYSSRYRISADLATTIVDVARAEGIDPELGFRLVKLESNFDERAISKVGAVGLTQLMPRTARYFEPQLSASRLFDRETNLRIGFRYLRGLLGEHRGDVKLALLVYNRGPMAVRNELRQGRNPTNGYDRIVTRGYLGRGIVD